MASTTTTTDNPVLGTGVNDSNMAFTCSTTSSTPTWPTLTEQIYTNNTTTTTTTMDPASFLDHSHHHHHQQHHHQPSFPQMVAPLTPDMHLMAMPPSSPSKPCPQVMDTAGCCGAFGTPYDAPTFSMDPQAPPGYKSEMMLPPTPEVSTVSMSPPDGVTMLSEHHHHSTAYVFGSNNGTDHMIQHESAPNPVDMMHHHPYFDNSNSELFSSSWSSPTTSSEEESGIATTAAAATVDCLQHPTTMTRDQLIGRVLELEHERRQYFTPLLLDMPDSSSAPAPAIKPTTMSSSRDTERYFCHWGECNVQTGQLAELIQHIRHVHVGSGKQAYYCKWAGCSRQDKPFVKRHKMHNHIRTHTGEKPFACKIQDCDKRFSRLDSLKTHMKTHLPVRPHLCTEHGCNKAYFHARSLRKHLKSHAIAASRRQQKQAQK
ncbi:zinc finger protein glis3 [Lichtheimia corymbifera JMRC:FSU:9682]|uniref:Zinc finger protein glis3 n=1 Tax=Lichtheimia corymbifera JMRC:FSU:9682 TaxID=1263082 RepID=A0A068RNV9_9FUNG|nr:zinc finger protein glis3 [Lichtheimia corymbifera JMRC:FSU:9682]